MTFYLIAHKVHGEPAFDVAVKMECPKCHGNCKDGRDPNGYTCVECDCLGYWWIIPTSGHRAYPYWNNPVPPIDDHRWGVPPMPPDLPDHYPATPTRSVSPPARAGESQQRTIPKLEDI